MTKQSLTKQSIRNLSKYENEDNVYSYKAFKYLYLHNKHLFSRDDKVVKTTKSKNAR